MQVFEQLQALLTGHAARFRLIEHPAAGKSVEAAAARGTEVSQGAKALVCRVRISSSQRKNVLAVFPADQQADLEAIARAAGGKKASLAYLGMLCVEPGLQSSGLGRRLLDAAEDAACAEGIKAMEMTVIDSRDTLIAWYERRGYVRTGETRPFPMLRDPPITFVVLEKPLAAP